jgi:hypothetical protein
MRIKHVPLLCSRLFLKEKKQGFLDDIYMHFSVVIIHLLYHNILTHALRLHEFYSVILLIVIFILFNNKLNRYTHGIYEYTGIDTRETITFEHRECDL